MQMPAQSVGVLGSLCKTRLKNCADMSPETWSDAAVLSHPHYLTLLEIAAISQQHGSQCGVQAGLGGCVRRGGEEHHFVLRFNRQIHKPTTHKQEWLRG